MINATEAAGYFKWIFLKNILTSSRINPVQKILPGLHVAQGKAIRERDRSRFRPRDGSGGFVLLPDTGL